MTRLLSPERVKQRGLIEPAEVGRLIEAHSAGQSNHAHVLFSLMVFEQWAESVGVTIERGR